MDEKVEFLFNQLITMVRSYNPDAVEELTKAFYYAYEIHEKNPPRKSGDPFVTHPLEVDIILAGWYADITTLKGGLFHDTEEEYKGKRNIRREISKYFGEDTYSLVYMVTKVKKEDYSTKQDAENASVIKFMYSILKDVRGALVKLADRLHNMRTLEFQPRDKQIEIAKETLMYYVPLAHYLGLFKVRIELEDLSLKYLKPEEYQKTFESFHSYKLLHMESLKDTMKFISDFLKDERIPAELKTKTRNIYELYKRMNAGESIEQMHDMMAIKVIVNEISACYQSLDIVSGYYQEVPGTFIDYISNPKITGHQALHTTIIGEDNLLIQVRFKTPLMETRSGLGIASFWKQYPNEAPQKMNTYFQGTHFYQVVSDLVGVPMDDEETVKIIVDDALSETIVVQTPNGKKIELRKGDSVLDFAYNVHSEVGDNAIGAIIDNGHEVQSITTVLKNGDTVNVIMGNVSSEELIWRLKSDKVPKNNHTRKLIRTSLIRGDDKNLL